jgi:hypothetical protein
MLIDRVANRVTRCFCEKIAQRQQKITQKVAQPLALLRSILGDFFMAKILPKSLGNFF